LGYLIDRRFAMRCILLIVFAYAKYIDILV